MSSKITDNQDNLTNELDVRAILKNLSVQDFLHFGLEHVVYIRPAGIDTYFVHAADGTVLSVSESMDKAVSSAHFSELEVVTLH